MCLSTKQIIANTEGYSFSCCGECRELSTSEDGTQPSVGLLSGIFKCFIPPESSKAHLSSPPEKSVYRSQEFVGFPFLPKVPS